MRLSDTQIRKAKPDTKTYRLTDGGGLYLVVSPTGGKLWRVKFRFNRLEKLMGLGRYPEVSLAMARERHAAARRLLADGIDPMEARKAQRLAIAPQEPATTFEYVAGLWLKHWQAGVTKRHADIVSRRLDTNVFPLLGARPIGEIETPELVAMVKAIEGRGVTYLPKSAMETCGQIFRYAIAHGMCKRNPVADIKPADVLKPRTTTHRARVDAAALPGLLRSIEVYQGTQVTRLACKLMALTFVRTAELIGAEWSEFDIPGRVWRIPKERMKMDSPHIVPLATQTIELLRLLLAVTGGSKYLFPGSQGAATISNNTILYALYRMGYKGDMTGHGFRGVASTLLHEQGWPHDHIELQQAHVQRDAVSAAYNFALYLEPRARMMQAWADFLEGQLRGK